MNQQRLTFYAILAAGFLILVSQTLYIVDQRSQAVVVRLGEPVRVVNPPSDNSPGLKAKVPFVERVFLFDKRNIALEPAEEEIIASNQERLVVDAFLRYRISDPLAFYRAARNEEGASALLERLVNSALREALGTATTEEIISSKRAELMRQVRDAVAQRATASRLGIQVVDLRIKRADLPTANEDAVYERMKTQRLQEAQEIRAIGEQQAREIRAGATKEAEETRGQGDAERARIFASSFGKDASFAAFYRSMQAYEASMAQGDKTLVLSPDSDFFRYFRGGPGQ